MNRTSSLRVITPLLLAAIMGLLGWNNHQSLQKLREERDALISSAAEKNLDLKAPLPLSARVHKPKHTKNLDRIARDFIAYAIEFQDYYHDHEIQKLDPAIRQRMMNQMDEILSLNPDELKTLIHLISHEPEIHSNTRNQLLQFTLHRFAESKPMEALSLMLDSPEILTSLRGHARSILEHHLPTLATNQLSETKAWLRLQSKNIPSDLLEISAYYIAQQAIQSNLMEAFTIADFKETTAWLALNQHTPEELEFIWNPAHDDLGYYIKTEETSQWLLWLQDTFTPEQSKRRIDQLLERWHKRAPEAATSFANTHGFKMK